MNLAARLKTALPADAYSLLRLVAGEATRRGLTLYAVGGLPRDLLLHRATRDLDLVLQSDAIPFARALARALGGRVTAHPAFHTATWFLPPNLAPASIPYIDLISARSEAYSHPAALPTVTLGDLQDDLLRRDFTINALAIRLDGENFGELLDSFNGRMDIEKKSIRVLHPRSFIDDPTRIFRALRYSARYKFNLARDTASLLSNALKYVNKLSPERLRHELDLIFEEDNSAEILSHIVDLSLFAVIKPALPSFDPARSRLLKKTPPESFNLISDRVSLGYHLWLIDSEDALLVKIASRLSLTADLTKSLRAAARLKGDLPSLAGSKPSIWTERLDQVPPSGIYAVHLVTRKPALYKYLAEWRHIKATVTGEELIARGLTPGPEFKRILSRLRAAWIDGEVGDAVDEKKLLDSLVKGN